MMPLVPCEKGRAKTNVVRPVGSANRFRWSPVFVGDVREVIVFSGALSDGDLKRFDDSEKAWLAGEATAT